ncbi:MAG: FHA domain-containing protein [Kangiellaceae bacterium]|nr:FHA domain-containing protein [Kangiellaceae bacterium]
MAYLALIVEDVVINKWDLNEDVVILGRTKDCDIQIDDQSVSSKHARIVTEADPYFANNKVAYLEDLKSTNGTQLNGKPVNREKLSDGDTVKIGFTQFQYVENQDNNFDETAVILS